MRQLVELQRYRMFRLVLSFALSVLYLAKFRDARGDEMSGPLAWQQDYHAALLSAQDAQGYVLIWFFDPAQDIRSAKWEAEVLGDKEISKRLQEFTLAKLPLGTTIPVPDGKSESTMLLKHAAFDEMLGKPGLAMIDMQDPESPHFHRVVSVCPFDERPISRDELLALLDLPNGSLTQRTLIWAVRTHAEHPQSATGEYSPLLAAETQSHAAHQASINLQGHHNWDSRFQTINEKLGSGMVSREVCAESWPGQRLVAAAHECVHSWRQSSGHWEAVSGKHHCFGYDMKLGSRGIWYGTGIFGDRR
jgi:hypothetical protein